MLLSRKLSLNDLDADGRTAAIERINEGIDQAAEMGCARLAVLAGPDPGDADRPQALDLLVDSIGQLCKHGADQGVGITLETFDRAIDKKSLIGPSDYAAMFAARVRENHPDFGLLYDLSHMPLLDENAAQALGTLKDYLVHMHVGNAVCVEGCDAYGDQHPRFGYPGSANDVPELTEFLTTLFAIGYIEEGAPGPKPWVGIEVKPWGEETSELVLAQTKRVWRKAWAHLP